jgi:hypothetical protein
MTRLCEPWNGEAGREREKKTHHEGLDEEIEGR